MKLKSEPTVARIAKLLRAQPFNIRIEGHTDNVPIHNSQFSSNWQLSTARAVRDDGLFLYRVMAFRPTGSRPPVLPNSTLLRQTRQRKEDSRIAGSTLSCSLATRCNPHKPMALASTQTCPTLGRLQASRPAVNYFVKATGLSGR